MKQTPGEEQHLVPLLIELAIHDSLSDLLIEFTSTIETMLQTLNMHDKQAHQEIVNELNSSDERLGGSLLLNALFQRGLLFAIDQYTKKLPIHFLHQDNIGNTILHQLSKACQNIYNNVYSDRLDDEIDNGASRLIEIEHAINILETIATNQTIAFKQLTTEKKYLFNDRHESALSILLNVYNHAFCLDCEDETNIPLLQHLMIAYPKKVLLATYGRFFYDRENLSSQFISAVLMDILTDTGYISARFSFHNKKIEEHISEQDLEEIESHFYKTKLLFSNHSIGFGADNPFKEKEGFQEEIEMHDSYMLNCRTKKNYSLLSYPAVQRANSLPDDIFPITSCRSSHAQNPSQLSGYPVLFSPPFKHKIHKMR